MRVRIGNERVSFNETTKKHALLLSWSIVRNVVFLQLLHDMIRKRRIRPPVAAESTALVADSCQIIIRLTISMRSRAPDRKGA